MRALRFLLILAVVLSGIPARAGSEGPSRVRALKITILSTMLADGNELGEWGFAALVEADGHRILFDTGAHTDLVLKNAQTLGIDLASVPEVVLSHNHWDHVGGLLTLRQSVGSNHRSWNRDRLSGAGRIAHRPIECESTTRLYTRRSRFVPRQTCASRFHTASVGYGSSASGRARSGSM